MVEVEAEAAVLEHLAALFVPPRITRYNEEGNKSFPSFIFFGLQAHPPSRPLFFLSPLVAGAQAPPPRSLFFFPPARPLFSFRN